MGVAFSANRRPIGEQGGGKGRGAWFAAAKARQILKAPFLLSFLFPARAPAKETGSDGEKREGAESARAHIQMRPGRETTHEYRVAAAAVSPRRQ
ncbi:hypothetical protein FKM82_027576 [Ascaphus truei]